MNDLRKAVEDALKEGEIYDQFGARWGEKRIDAIHTALAQPEPEPEPVAYLWQHGETGRTRVIEKDQVWTASNQWNRVGPLYLHPPQRKPLTEDQIDAIVRRNVTITDRNLAGAVYMSTREVEAAHGIGGEE